MPVAAAVWTTARLVVMTDPVTEMRDNDRAPTADLALFRAAYEQDENIWWAIGSGHHEPVRCGMCRVG
jgi:hypothetical protein